MKFTIALLAIVISCPAIAVTPKQWIKLDANYAGPLEIMQTNASTSSEAMTEVRAINNTGCAHDFGVAGGNYSADVTLLANEAFLIGESTCAGMLIKQNNDTYIRFSLGINPVEKLRLEPNRVTITGGSAASLLVNGALGRFEIISGGADKDVFAGNVNPAPFHLMVGRDAKVTLNANGSVELWPSACQAPAHGGVTLCVEGGKLKAVTTTGITTLAQ